MGFNHFKIEGRTDSVKNLIEILTYYMVKEEFQMEIRQRLNEVKL
jgi:collagenase-like PrtC family protease